MEKLLHLTVPGDCIITMEVSRLARSTKQLCNLIDVVRDKHLKLVILGSITVDCSNGELDPMTKAFLQISGVFAELELSHHQSPRQIGNGKRESKRSIDWTPPHHRRANSCPFFEVLSSL